MTISLNTSARKQDHDTKRSLPDQDISNLSKTIRKKSPYNSINFFKRYDERLGPRRGSALYPSGFGWGVFEMIKQFRRRRFHIFFSGIMSNLRDILSQVLIDHVV